MSDTIGSLVDKLITVDMKLWNAQEFVYEIRRMTYEQFKEKYGNEEGMRMFYNALNKATELNYQRSQLVDEMDEKILEMLLQTQQGSDLLEAGLVRKAHKTY